MKTKADRISLNDSQFITFFAKLLRTEYSVPSCMYSVHSLVRSTINQKQKGITRNNE